MSSFCNSGSVARESLGNLNNGSQRLSGFLFSEGIVFAVAASQEASNAC